MKKIIRVLLVSMLFIGCSKDEETKAVTEAVVDNSTILTFTNVELSQTATSSTFGRYFSIKLGKTLKQSEVTTANGADIDFVYVGSNSNFIYFASPDDTDFQIAGAKKSLFKNFNSGFSVADFDAITLTDDSKLKNLDVVDDDNAIG